MDFYLDPCHQPVLIESPSHFAVWKQGLQYFLLLPVASNFFRNSKESRKLLDIFDNFFYFIVITSQLS